MKHIKPFEDVTNEKMMGTHIISIGQTIMKNLSEIQTKIVDKEQKRKMSFVKELVWRFKEGDRHMTEEEMDELYNSIVFNQR